MIKRLAGQDGHFIFYNGISGGLKHINGGQEMKGGCFIETVKIGARLPRVVKIILSRRQTCRRSGEELRTRLAEQETSAAWRRLRREGDIRKGLRSENVFLDHGKKGSRLL